LPPDPMNYDKTQAKENSLFLKGALKNAIEFQLLFIIIKSYLQRKWMAIHS